MGKLNEPALDTGALSSTVSAINGKSMAALNEAFSQWCKNANATANECVRFAQDRFNKDCQFLSKLAECKKPEDLLSVQSELVTTLVSDYMQQASKLLGMFGATNEAICNRFAQAIPKVS